MRLRLGLAALLVGVGAAWAQAAWAQAAWAQAPAPIACGGQAAQYAGGKGFALWVTRRGTLRRENPLRPLTPDELQVLQVVIRGKAATAYGPDLDTLRRGAAPASLEAQSGAAIRWGESIDGLPATLRILEDDGAGVLAALQFRSCGDAPKVAVAKAPKAEAPKRAAAPKPKANSKADQADSPPRLPNGFTLPQGAIP
ncbi:hypothetical protein [Methylobacterium nodulans]|uniref:Uncharacterized protein n=1 Tax=Methylobacterium nodulans (strain LMG 21967 / CNCM I-2342 / ORS 2060) TaxID=460265 RepID=B8ICX6_METNO|nr:hypothetical protein [Methylobacterium nodulans]ACL59368.1 conserved hypothetical protein [Methylobacterium nodulans ORS 2060]